MDPTNSTGYQYMNYLHFNVAADVTYGIICLSCFLVGTSGNAASFFYFWSKKRDISSSVYMMVTVTDTVISMLVLPVGISFLQDRSPGLLFRYRHTCAGWVFLWGVAVRSSIFFVLCLCVTRTYSLMKPFVRQKISYLMVAVVAYILLQIGQWVGLNKMGVYYAYTPEISACGMFLRESSSENVFLVLEISQILTFVLPSFVVATSCVLSAVMLTRDRGEGRQSEQRQSKNRATMTILLFALLYLACNIPLIVRLIIGTYATFTEGVHVYDFFVFDSHYYYETATATLLLAANSAVNPVLYFWRMPNVRKYSLSWIRGLLNRRRDRGEMRLLSLVKGTDISVCETRRGSSLRSGDLNHDGVQSQENCV